MTQGLDIRSSDAVHPLSSAIASLGKHDTREVPISDIKFRVDPTAVSSLSFEDRSVSLQETAEANFYNTAEIPTKFAKRVPPSLLVQFLEHARSTNPHLAGGKLVVSESAGSLVAEQFVPQGSSWVPAYGVLEALGENGGEELLVHRLMPGKASLYASLVIPGTETNLAVSGDTADLVYGGLSVEHAYKGQAAIKLSGYLFRLVCANGLIIPTGGVRLTRHVFVKDRETWGKELGEKAKSLVGTIGHQIESLRATMAMPAPPVAQLLRSLELLVKISPKLRERLWEVFELTPPNSMYEAINMITALAHEYAADNRRLLLQTERLGGQLLAHNHPCDACGRLS